MGTKRYLLKLSNDRVKRENALRILDNLGAGKIELCCELANIYCIEMDEGLATFISEVTGIKLEEERVGALCENV
jgi:hypothetical protein